jgi:hypothetical protein
MDILAQSRQGPEAQRLIIKGCEDAKIYKNLCVFAALRLCANFLLDKERREDERDGRQQFD